MALLSSSSSSSSSCCTQAVVPHSVLQQQPHHHHHHHLQQRPKWLASCCRPRAGPVSFHSVQQCSSAKSVFSGYHAQLADCVWAAAPSSTSIRPIVCMTKPSIQFIKGIDEQTVPNVSLTKSRDGTNGVATFLFDQPSVFDSSRELGDITGLYLLDEEGVLQSVDVSAKFVNGKPAIIEAKYIMRTPKDWDRFMRFMERYAEANGLGFVKK